jgi:hypothetical protein
MSADDRSSLVICALVELLRFCFSFVLFPFLFCLLGLAIASPLLSPCEGETRGNLLFPYAFEHNPNESDNEPAVE